MGEVHSHGEGRVNHKVYAYTSPAVLNQQPLPLRVISCMYKRFSKLHGIAQRAFPASMVIYIKCINGN